MKLPFTQPYYFLQLCEIYVFRGYDSVTKSFRYFVLFREEFSHKADMIRIFELVFEVSILLYLTSKTNISKIRCT